MLRVATDAQAQDELRLDLDQLVREGARRMLAAALEAEVDAYLAGHAVERDEGGRRLVVGNGHARQRQVTTAAGAVAVRAPRVDDRRADPVTGQRIRFRSVILPPWCRKSPQVAEVLPLLYLHGLSTGDFVPALEAFFGSAAGLSAAVITRLVTAWQADHEAFGRRDLTDRDYVYSWADGVHFRVRLEQARLCCLVIVGVRVDGTKELVAVADGERESTDSWAEVLRDLRRRGMQAPVVAVGDGALGLWAALRDVFPETRHQRDWVHKLANVLGCLPKAVQAGARKALVVDQPMREVLSREVALQHAAKQPALLPRGVGEAPVATRGGALAGAVDDRPGFAAEVGQAACDAGGAASERRGQPHGLHPRHEAALRVRRLDDQAVHPHVLGGSRAVAHHISIPPLTDQTCPVM